MGKKGGKDGVPPESPEFVAFLHQRFREREPDAIKDQLRKETGKLLKRWRKAAGKTLRGVEEEFGKGFKHSYLWRLESGNAPSPRLETIALLARNYDVPVWQLREDVAAVLSGAVYTLADMDEDLAETKVVREIDRVFEFVASARDFPTSKVIVNKDRFRGTGPVDKLIMILMYEEQTGLRLLPDWVVEQTRELVQAVGGAVDESPDDD